MPLDAANTTDQFPYQQSTFAEDGRNFNKKGYGSRRRSSTWSSAASPIFEHPFCATAVVMAYLPSCPGNPVSQALPIAYYAQRDFLGDGHSLAQHCSVPEPHPLMDYLIFMLPRHSYIRRLNGRFAVHNVGKTPPATSTSGYPISLRNHWLTFFLT
ncbi:hypothetical protein BDN70DRAFT_342544 [Pholiota conissans]|uniref:Uncharacterized protein n=1 Tax=Pholiota conissans TaxID=109636 RepID=A0A9P5Z9C7_9AGAR|nr:hypothetical protein BDN70DRAFT_342544 [Pholiota conissans]